MLKLDRLRHQYTKPLPALHLQQMGAGSLNEPVMGHGWPGRAWAGGFASPYVLPDSVQHYLQGKFGAALEDAYAAMQELATSRPSAALAAEAYALYEHFRPAVPTGTKGRGAAGTLHLDVIRKMAQTGKGD